MSFNFSEGEVLLIDKPKTWSSFDVVKKVRNMTRVKKVGHAGTLDPLATGLLIICTGKKTKQIDSYQGLEKQYEGQILLGKTTPSCDLETEFENEKDISHINLEDLNSAIIRFLGTVKQTPPIFSAVKIEGKRAYELAREGKSPEVKERQVFIREFLLTKIELPYIHFSVTCSKGTYIRSLARDFGEAVGVGGCLTELRRTRIGSFHVKDAITPDQIYNLINEGIQGT